MQASRHTQIKMTQLTKVDVLLDVILKQISSPKTAHETVTTVKITAFTKSLPQKVRNKPRMMKIIPIYGAAGFMNSWSLSTPY